MSQEIWRECIESLQAELSVQQFNTWIRPLTVEDDPAGHILKLIAPNRFVLDWVNDKYRVRIEELLANTHSAIDTLEVVVSSVKPTRYTPPAHASPSVSPSRYAQTSQHTAPNNDVSARLAAQQSAQAAAENSNEAHSIFDQSDAPGFESQEAREPARQAPTAQPLLTTQPYLAENTMLEPQRHAPQPASVNDKSSVVSQHKSNLNTNFVFDNFVVGKSNQLGLAAATQVAENPGGSYNPLFIYGGVGLGKTHLMHAVGNALCQTKKNARVVYLHSERFVADMVKALQLNAINDFKRFYRSVDALLIDDIQFFAGKERSQEEFFHTFNALLEGNQQIILTCDRYPKEINGLEERLMSRFGWGLTVAIEPPELETRVAILKRKAEQVGEPLPNDAAFFIAQRIRSNVRELEGALKRVIANAHFTGREISVALVREALKDLLVLQDRLVSIDNIQKVVADYYKIRISDIHSKRRSRSIARPRQVAMYLSKDLTNHSLPEIGEAFGGRDHTTVLHACRKIKGMSETDSDIREDLKNLLRTLTT